MVIYMYFSLVRPHFECGCPVWDPQGYYYGVQKFSLRFAAYVYCDGNYQDVLELFQVPSLKEQRLELNFGLLFKIVHNVCHFPTVPELRGGLG